MTFAGEKKRSAVRFWKPRNKGEEVIQLVQRFRSDKGHQGSKQHTDTEIKLARCQGNNWKKQRSINAVAESAGPLLPPFPNWLCSPNLAPYPSVNETAQERYSRALKQGQKPLGWLLIFLGWAHPTRCFSHLMSSFSPSSGKCFSTPFVNYVTGFVARAIGYWA